MPVEDIQKLGYRGTLIQRIGGDALQIVSAAGIPAAADHGAEIPVYAAGSSMIAPGNGGVEVFGDKKKLIFIGKYQFQRENQIMIAFVGPVDAQGQRQFRQIVHDMISFLPHYGYYSKPRGRSRKLRRKTTEERCCLRESKALRHAGRKAFDRGNERKRECSVRLPLLFAQGVQIRNVRRIKLAEFLQIVKFPYRPLRIFADI